MLNKKILTQLYYSFLYPFIIYCNVIWGNAPDTHTSQIFKLQKWAIRIICNIRKRDSTKSSFHQLKILRFPDIFRLSTLLFVFKFKNGFLPPVFVNFFQENQQFHNYPTRQAHKFRNPKTRLKIASSFIKCSGSILWNALPPCISSITKIGSFKREIKIHLLSTYII
jgi:hypothetical protein